MALTVTAIFLGIVTYKTAKEVTAALGNTGRQGTEGDKVVARLTGLARTTSMVMFAAVVLMIVMSPLVNEASFDQSIYCELGFMGYRLLETIGVAGLAWVLRGGSPGQNSPYKSSGTPAEPNGINKNGDGGIAVVEEEP